MVSNHHNRDTIRGRHAFEEANLGKILPNLFLILGMRGLITYAFGSFLAFGRTVGRVAAPVFIAWGKELFALRVVAGSIRFVAKQAARQLGIRSGHETDGP